MQLELPTRIKIAGQFGIQKRGSTEVVDNQIKSDGYNIKEIEEALNVDALQTYLGTSETDMSVLWKMLINKTEGREDIIQPPVQEPQLEVDKQIEAMDKFDEIMKPMITPIKKKSGRPRKNA